MVGFLQKFGFFLSLLLLLAMLWNVLWYGLNNPDTGLGKWIYSWWPFGQPKKVTERLKKEQKEVEKELKAATRMSQPSDIIPDQLKVGNVIQIGGDMLDVTGKALLLELKYYDGDKTNKVHVSPKGEVLREFLWFSLANGDIITVLPDKEAGQLVLYYGIDVFDKVEGSMLSATEAPGKRFAASNQEDKNVELSIPGIDGSYTCTDIVWADIQVGDEDGKNRFGSPNGPTTWITTLLAKSNADTGEFLLSIMLRKGKGDHGLYLLRPFDPDVEVEQIL